MTRREIGYAEDDTMGCYEWQLARVVDEDGCYSIVTEGGCSCNGPGSECSGVTAVGPSATLGGLFDEIVASNQPKYIKEAFLDAIERQNKETIGATKKALGLNE